MTFIDKKITISFCVTFYNQENFVDRCLSSIIKQQTIHNIEILVGDDGSTDKTISRIIDFQKKHPSIIQLYSSAEINKSIINPIIRASNNRLNLLRKSKGDFILFVDGDDYYCNFNFIDEALKHFKYNKNLSVCAFDYKIEGSEKIFHKNLFVTKEDYIKRGYTHSAACVFKKKYLSPDTIELFSKYKCFDDNLITLSFLSKGDFVFINMIIYSYTQNTNSIWNSTTTIEKVILNALDFNLSSRLCPLLKKLLLLRYYHNISYLWRNKKNIRNNLPNYKLNEFKDRALFYDDGLIFVILNWENALLKDKLLATYSFLKLRLYKKIGS